jgi:hypothetical protein
VLLGGDFLLRSPRTPLPPQWNPLAPLRLADPETPVTHWKLSQALGSEAACRAALTEAGASAEALPDLEDGPLCHIRQRVSLAAVGEARLSPVETRCQVALRLAYWERHGLQPAAAAHLGARVAEIEHLSSYSCREMRVAGGAGGRMSLHATAEAIDVTGFRLDNGRRITLAAGWEGGADEAAFLRAARDSACRWFATTLGPEYNALHADHFHLQSRGWGLCR